MPASALPPYAVISPVRDEEAHLARTAESLIAQLHRPAAWVIVDDGSADSTLSIAERYARRHEWIHVISSGTTHRRARGAPIVRAFSAGLAEVADPPPIVVKLDGDLYLPPHFFAWICRVFADDERAGIVGGPTLVPGPGGRWLFDSIDVDTIPGVAKAYRRACLAEIGGLPESMGWDGIDEYAARARGWNVHVLTELPILHYRPRGRRQSWLRARWEEGRANRYMGYRWSFIALRVAKQMLVQHPPVLGGAALGAGFVVSALLRRPQYPDRMARELLREGQRRRVFRMAKGRPRDAARPLPSGGPAYSATGSAIQDS